MAVNPNDIVYREWPTYTHFWLDGALAKICGANPIELPSGSTVDDAVVRFKAQIAQLKDQEELRHFIQMPLPMDIARAANDRIETMLAELADIHDTLKALNLFGATDDATEVAVNAAANTKALTLKNALTAYKQHWKDNSFDTEQADALENPAAWKTALKNFAANNLGTLEWLRMI
jgi:hypothetical protein